MIAQLIRLEVAPELRAQALALQQVNVEQTRLEPGCRRFDFAAAKDEPGVYYVWEVFEDQAALDAHYAGAYFQAWRTWMLAQPEGKIVRTRFPIDPLWL
ncbi:MULTISPECIES: putative quinol monooxygenase [Nitrospirillum]|uniref:Quinol monooxygenase YgiN n=1 Tax=Nitrospirillum amazonense TaxID=28077 RepID=A0A560EX33_9PROT|nr:putative quinol monooxygenase [Nitrospirillum amazonense]MEC4592804.1 putative quinol monooxygenase [Nitrospirillum amazonense]TWB13939.1 quinol monooxygenase YgiN [Nitrospirillum amazonense]